MRPPSTLSGHSVKLGAITSPGLEALVRMPTTARFAALPNIGAAKEPSVVDPGPTLRIRVRYPDGARHEVNVGANMPAMQLLQKAFEQWPERGSTVAHLQLFDPVARRLLALDEVLHHQGMRDRSVVLLQTTDADP
ncbi:uncharacterized protein MONBRDRAFT_29402 [Monosiga brevicollis MX1]|uniref:Uncharacterized protein n=1 Tax=Monosiga brevicollis TaxID=81824 RepID=A9VAZ7_MONBE|nr:uncharacterized protein MONBRDRAFT_29402 [Monosiga brevicollis MX1]EDQ85251.1 predicted protein [Monosiga brevicollis MX1]|eukprot:XP_001749872.1 hypothetical protein [Monosiga brevicollis MX1]